jgi:flagellar basal-body rod protein FlgB
MPLIDTTQAALEAAMRGSMQRQSLLSNNLANVDTPGYVPQDLNFQSTLASAVQSGQALDNVSFQSYSDPSAIRADGNEVSAEAEQAKLSENGLLYENLTSIAATREQILKTAMGL